MSAGVSRSSDTLSKSRPEFLFNKEPISNQGLLTATTMLFAVFVIAEVIGGLSAKSLSLLGDAAAMSIDVFTYGSNLYAECSKDSELSPSKKILTQVAIPIFSLTCLLAVTVWVAVDAFLRLRRHKEVEVGLNLMYIFAGVNFCVDACCVILFLARKNNVFSQKTRQNFDILHSIDDWSVHDDDEEEEGIDMTVFHGVESLRLVQSSVDEDGKHLEEEAPNLNMISAFTHVWGDTLRTIAIFAAALVSTIFGVDPQISDAWAGIAVSLTIVIAVLPLLFYVKKSIQQLCSIGAGSGANGSSKTSGSE